VIWIAWRFQRSVVIALVLLGLIVIGGALFVGVVQHHDLVQLQSVRCRRVQTVIPQNCNPTLVLANVSWLDSYIRVAGYVFAPLVGALLGVFALASEIDNRTARLAWTQSISRTRWFVAKAGVGAATVTVILVPTAIVLSWWNGAVGSNNIFGAQTFDIAGWVLVAYGLFMFALTMLLGAVIRRVGWALAASVLVFLLVAVVVPRERAHFVPSTVSWQTISVSSKGATVTYSGAFAANSWLLVNGVVPRSTVGTPTWNEVLATQPRVQTCVSDFKTKTESAYVKAERSCYKRFDVEQVSVYIAGDQFWTLQLREGLLYLGAGLVLAGGALVLVRRVEP